MAIEVARRLQGHGRTVEAVLLFDSIVGAEPLGLSFAWRQWSSWARRNLEFTIQFGPRYFWDKLRSKLWRSAHGTASRYNAAQAGEADDAVAHFAHFNIVREIYQRVQRSYRPRSIPSRATLFLSSDTIGCKVDPSLGAAAVFSNGVEVVRVPGNHASMLETPHLHALAAEVRRALRPA
jgi:thioesterase domain-containing protein